MRSVGVAYLDRQMFATTVRMIPAGKLTAQEAICEVWAKRNGVDYCGIQHNGLLPLDKRFFGDPPMFSV